MPFNPTDPLFDRQWHFDRIGNIRAIWEEYNGSGVNVGVYDEGIEQTHTDLNDNYNAALEFSYNGSIPNTGATGPHGTSVAGLIGAEANDEGTVGIAFGASLTSVNIFDSSSDLFINAGTPTGFFAAVAYNAFDVVNNSWGSTPGYAAFQNRNTAGSFAAETVAGWQNVADTGRGGLGTIVLKAAGNESRNANAEGSNSARFVIDVAAVGDSGFAASYSNHGANILVSAPGSEFESNGGLGIVTTDLTGTAGYNLRGDPAGSYDYTDDFGGTSAATPIVSGVVTLMLDANAGLGWRDVQDILAMSATHTGSSLVSTTPGTFENDIWKINGATNWNGGGMHFHNNYGFGMVNAYNAVRMAEVWSLFDSAHTSTAGNNTISFFASPAMALADLTDNTYAFNIPFDQTMENVQVTLNYTHSFMSDLIISLISPTGDRYILEDRTAGNSSAADGGLTWTYGIQGLRGENTAGNWILSINDVVGADSGTLNSVQITFHGTTNDSSDTYHFTDEFQLMAMLDPSRRTVSDTDGGTDWLNMAAISGDIVLRLDQNAYSSINGTQFIRIANGTDIENAVTGDGDDLIQGNSLANQLMGMRGSDTIRSYAGSDILDGGQGADYMFGGADSDRYYVDNDGDVVVENAGEGNDIVHASTAAYMLTANVERLIGTLDSGQNLVGNTLNNIITAGGGNDTLNGGAGIDTMIGGLGDDIYVVDNASDVVTEAAGEGIDTVRTGLATYALAANVENLQGVLSAGQSLTGNTLDNTITGAIGADIINGASGADTMIGGRGNDTYYLDNAGDVVTELLDEGTADEVRTVLASYALAANVEKLTGTSAAGQLLVGNTLDNIIRGFSGNDTINGGVGADTMTGLAGNDIFIVDNVGDVVVESAGQGTDEVRTTLSSYALAANVENLRGTLAAGQMLTGNTLANTITGAAGNDSINGGTGADTMIGGLGDDTYVVDNAGDVVTEAAAEGSDTVRTGLASYTLGANVENLIGSLSAGQTLNGNTLNNTITGANGGDTINGGLGSDNLTGSGGADHFVFDTALGASNVDRILDFSVPADTMDLDDAIFTAIGPLGTLNANAFRIGTSALDADDRIFYNSVSGFVFYDQDGNGALAPVLFAKLTAGLALTNADFVVI
ncbi:Ca2+-binding RTX toxin-like protein/subtilisin-like proprotein convertase family protein [Sphingobium fontiphilum]|uniref:Ca2+-binding RTX toxin-like protein/subtilisin-like proprotein convertase family protein n=1 Tax=Sphingobium fontiphilum TaxID=944425 RepID=A0A7W6DHJ0_9SPHN|nr:S8 family serine peptidase [Sphingobium fontiphilum]MBB3981416.1 Ca2+-binding RTX toxin-like protein/subtilisin-like proprotein convertase family protein [Sphingobium fontiphilum]